MRQAIIRLAFLFAAVALANAALPVAAAASTLTPKTKAVWDRYQALVNSRVDGELADPNRFLVQDFFAPAERQQIRRRLEAGEIVIKKMSLAQFKQNVPDGEIHHWWGAVLAPNVKLDELLSVLKDYDHHAGKFEEVERSRLLSKSDDRYKFLLRLRRSKAFVTVSYNTEQEAVYTVHGPGRVSSRSVATKIAQLDDAGTPEERELPLGQDSGYLWRLASWWRFQQTERGVIVELESASLSRDIPTIVNFIPGLSGYIRNTPKESLHSVLSSVRQHSPAAARK
jgi:hypothetical protein